MRVLIADDQPGVGHTVALLVNAAKHHVVKVVTSGADAIRAYHIYRPDVVLMDYTMARLNVATRSGVVISGDPADSLVCVTMITALTVPDDRTSRQMQHPGG